MITSWLSSSPPLQARGPVDLSPPLPSPPTTLRSNPSQERQERCLSHSPLTTCWSRPERSTSPPSSHRSMTEAFVDVNIIIRLLTGDDPQKQQASLKLF